jgi:hypothetical protein
VEPCREPNYIYCGCPEDGDTRDGVLEILTSAGGPVFDLNVGLAEDNELVIGLAVTLAEVLASKIVMVEEVGLPGGLTDGHIGELEMAAGDGLPDGPTGGLAL